jgi:predicted nucleic acid-binding protein
VTHSLVVDASVAVKWILHEPDSELAVGVALEGHRLRAPIFILIEAANALRKNVSAGQLDAAAAFHAWEELLASPLELDEVGAELCGAALELALSVGHPAQDCLYLALALRENARVLTDDRKFAAAARRAGLGRGVALLGEPLD